MPADWVPADWVPADWVPWAWLIAGLALCAAEIVAPGVFLLWIGLAALTMGCLTLLVAVPFAPSFLLFGGLALAFSLLGKRLYGGWQSEPGLPLNRRAEGLIGQVLTLAEPIANGRGRARVHDSLWRVSGPDLPAGAQVRVTGVVEGVVLSVVPA